MHPAHYITEAEVKRVGDYIQQHLRERKARLEAKRQGPKPLAPITYADAYAARDARLDFESQPNHEEILRLVYDDQNELFELEAAMLTILKNDLRHMTRGDADDAKRRLLGYEQKDPSVKGMLDTFHHVPGRLEITREKLTDIEAKLPILQQKAARYAHVRESLKPWPWHRINQVRQAALDQQEILNGRLPEQRGNGQDMTGWSPQVR